MASMPTISLLAAIAVCAQALAGCGDEPRRLDADNIEEGLAAALQPRLGRAEIRQVDCLFLTPTLTRCFARGTAPGGDFRMPVSVHGRLSEASWSVTAENLREARSGVSPPLLRPGEAVTVERPAASPVRLRVRLPEDPLDVAPPEVPPKAGHRYVAVLVDFRNRGSLPYADRPRSRVSGTLSDGSLVPTAPVDERTCGTLQLCRVRLSGGEATTGYLVFEVPRKLQLASVAIQLEASDEILEWRVQPGPPPT